MASNSCGPSILKTANTFRGSIDCLSYHPVPSSCQMHSTVSSRGYAISTTNEDSADVWGCIGYQSEGIHSVQPQVLHGGDELVHVVRLRSRDMVLSRRGYCTEVDPQERRQVLPIDRYLCFIIISTTDNFSTLCYVRADLSPLAGSAQPKQGTGGKMYWTIVFSIEIHFGLTEFRARIKWMDNVRNYACVLCYVG